MYEKHGYTKCYLLVTSSHGDRKASFQVDGKDYSVNVPFYSGFIGQWGWTGESEGYMKDASIAYIGTHRHSSRVGGNESYIYTYLYKICLDIAPDAKALTLPKDAGVALIRTMIQSLQQRCVPCLMKLQKWNIRLNLWLLPVAVERTEGMSESEIFASCW